MGNQISTLQRKENGVPLISNMSFQRLLSGFSEEFKFPSGIRLLFSLGTDVRGTVFSACIAMTYSLHLF